MTALESELRTDQQPNREKSADLMQRNVETLEGAGEVGAFFAELYRHAYRIEPLVGNAIVLPSGKDEYSTLAHTGGFARHQEEGDGTHPKIVVNTADGWAHYEHFIQERKSSARLAAEKCGKNPDAITPQFMAAFIFLHELGHTVDYQTRVTTLAAKSEKRRAEINGLPAPGYDPVQLRKFLDTPEGAAYLRQYAGYFRSEYGVTSRDDLLRVQDEAYRSIDSEDYADQFAAAILGSLSDT